MKTGERLSVRFFQLPETIPSRSKKFKTSSTRLAIKSPMENDSHDTSLPAPSASEHFEHWLLQRSLSPRERLTLDAARPYRYIWGSWIKWIGSPHTHHPACNWQDAKPMHIWSFLQHGVTPSSSRKITSSEISEITRRRYWRVLDTLYEHALARQLISENPTRSLSEPRPEPERPEGQVFNALQFRAIRDTLPENKFRWDKRDRAILLLLMDAALTTGEVCQLQMHQVQDQLKATALVLDGPRASQERTLQLDSSASAAMKAWMTQRSTLQSEQHQRHVFITQQGKPMSPRAVFHLVSSTARRAFTTHQIDIPNHIGAQVLRNTRLVMWMNSGMDADEVVRRAGYKDVRSFRGLVRHLSQLPHA